MNITLKVLPFALAAALAVPPAYAQPRAGIDAATANHAETRAAQNPDQSGQNASDQNESAQTDQQPQKLGTVVVTATKRVQPMQDVPASISVVTAEDVTTAGLTSPADLPMLVPGLTMVPIAGPQTANVVMRGVSTTIGEPNVGFFIDGVYIPDRSAANFLLAGNIARIEVARGPQYALYGQNTFGGAINFITKAPSDEPHAWIAAGVANYDSHHLRLGASGPIADGSTFHYRAGVARRKFGGFYRNDLTGDKLDGSTEDNAFVTLTGGFDNGLHARLNAIYDRKRIDAYPQRFVPNNSDFSPRFNDYQTFVGDVPSLTSGFAVTPGHINRKAILSSLTLDYGLDWANLTSVTAYNHLERDQYYDSDFTAAPIQMVGLSGPQTSVSEDLRLASFGNVRFDWLVGLYYYHLDDHHVDRTTWVGPAAPLGGRVSDNHEYTRSTAVYGSLTWHISPTWDLKGVMRYTRETKSIHTVTTVLPSAPAPQGATAVFDGSRTFTPFTPGLYLTWKPTPDARVYASVVKAIKVGGFNTFTTNGAIAPDERSYDSARTTTYELGTKLTMADGRVFLNMDVYRINWRDMIVRTIGSQGALLNANAGRSHSQGAEFDLRYDPDQHWSFRIGGSYNQAQYDEYIFPILALVGLNPNLAGTRLQYAPQWTASTSIVNQTSLGGGWSLTTRLDGHYRSDMAAVQYATATIPAVTVFNLHVNFEKGPWRIGLWSNNLFNAKEAPGAVFTGDPATTFQFATGQRAGLQLFQGLVNAPRLRTYGIDIRYQF